MPRRKTLSASSSGQLVQARLTKFDPLFFHGQGVLFRPYFLLDVDPRQDGTLRARNELTRVIQVERPHSLFSYRDFLFFVGTKTGTEYLFIYNGVEHVQLAPAPVRGERLYYVPIGSLLFMSNVYWHGVFDFDVFTLRPFSEKVPDTYAFLPEGSPAGEQRDLFTLPPLDNLCFHQSRLVGSIGNKIIFSEAGLYEFTRSFYYITLPEPINVLAPIADTLYAAGATRTYVIKGNLLEPQYEEKPFGGVKGTLTYVSMKGYKVPVWAGRLSLIAGLPGGELKFLTEPYMDIQFDTDSEGATVYDESRDRVISSTPLAQRDTEITDNFITEVVRRGSLREAIKRRKDLWREK